MYRYNSTIRIKEKKCKSCGKSCVWFSKKRCKTCATYEDSLRRMEEETEKDIKEKGLEELIDIADNIFSKWLRLSQADENGMVECFLFGTKIRWQDADCAHFVKRRANLYLRFDPRNVTVQSKYANETKDGHMDIYTEKLEKIHPGITDILREEGRLVYKPTRSEIQSIITEYTNKFRKLQNKNEKL